MKLCFVLVTRNRPDYASAAIRSLLSQEGAGAFDLVVSDNSETADEARRLEEYCRGARDSRLIYIRPADPMPMAPHWNWAIEQAMERSDATHFGVQYDRKLWKPGELRVLAAACALDPRATLSYGSDVAFLTPQGFQAWVVPMSGRLYEIRTSAIVHLSSRGMLTELAASYPMLSNCMTPRSTIERVRTRFGSICDSSTPDVVYTYRLCALDERYLHLDRAAVLTYGYRVSNGFSYLRGDVGNTHRESVIAHSGRVWLEAAPIPGLDLGLNIMFHEYGLVQREVGEERFPPIDRQGYLRELARGLLWIDDPSRKKKMRRILREHGWLEQKRPLVRRVLSRLRHALHAGPPALTAPIFATEGEAVEYLIQPRPFLQDNPQIAVLDPVEVPFPA